MLNKLSRVFGLLFLIIVLCFVSGCAKGNIEKNMNPAEDIPVTLKLKWVHQAQFAGNYVAKERGFYRDEGLSVQLVPFSFESPTIDAVANGEADFGITGADELIVARSKGIPIKAIAVIYKITPVCVYALKESGITKPQDLLGKTVGLERGTNVDLLYYVMMSRLGINESTIKEISIGYDASELLNGTTDASTGYVINEPQQVIEAGHDVTTILVADYGANMYADVLFTTDDMITTKPDLVQEMLRATIRGWEYAIEHNGEAIDDVMKYATQSTRQHEQYMLEQSIPLINTGDGFIGWMNKEQWDLAQEILLEQGILDNPVNMNDVYTMQFLDQIYENTGEEDGAQQQI